MSGPPTGLVLDAGPNSGGVIPTPPPGAGMTEESTLFHAAGVDWHALDSHHMEPDRPAVLMLHHFGGSARSWDAVAAALAPAGVRRVRPDWAGFGDSAPLPPDTAPDDVPGVLAGLVEALDLGRFTLVGHSMGGKIALQYAATRPAGLGRVVLLGPAPPGVDYGFRPPGGAAEVRAKHADPAAGAEIYEDSVGRPLPGEYEQRFLADHARASRAGWDFWCDAHGTFDVSDEYPNVNVPVTVLCGTADTQEPPAVVREETAVALPDCRVWELPGCGHLLPWEAPGAVAAAILDG